MNSRETKTERIDEIQRKNGTLIKWGEVWGYRQDEQQGDKDKEN